MVDVRIMKKIFDMDILAGLQSVVCEMDILWLFDESNTIYGIIFIEMGNI